MEKNASLFEEATEGSLTERDEQRDRMIKEVERNIEDNALPHQELFKGIIEKNYESALWEDEAKTCVECGACNAICPTCHCFLLYDQKDEERMGRLRTWDSCMLKDFARVAGGANPRPRLWMRLRNRFEKNSIFPPGGGHLRLHRLRPLYIGLPGKDRHKEGPQVFLRESPGYE